MTPEAPVHDDDPTARTEATGGFPGRSDLDALLAEILPDGWVRTALDGDEVTMTTLLAAVDKPAIVRALGRNGWIAPHWPAAEGGRDLTIDQAKAVATYLDHREVPRLPRGAGLQLAAPAILRWARPPVRRRLLPRIASGEDQWCQLFSEPGAGSDLASLSTSAVRRADGWVVNGQKVWTTMAQHADFGMLLARTDPAAPKHQGITYFALRMDSPGVDARPLRNIAGQAEFNEVFLTDVLVPDDCRITEVGAGWQAALTTLSSERSALSGARKKRRPKDEILGGRTFPQVLALARQTGRIHDRVVRDQLARAWSRERVLQLTTARARLDGANVGSITKLLKAESNQSLQLVAMSLLGANATAWLEGEPDPLEASDCVTQMLRTRANSIEGGTSEIQRNIIAERILGMPREPDALRGAPWNTVPRS